MEVFVILVECDFLCLLTSVSDTYVPSCTITAPTYPQLHGNKPVQPAAEPSGNTSLLNPN